MVIWCSIVPVLYLAINLYIYVIIASAIFSWLYAFNIVNTRNQFVAMIAHFLHALTEPAFRPIRRFMPNLGGIDLSPIVVILLLIVLQNLLRQGSGCFGY